MKNVPKLIDKQLLDHFPVRRFGTFGVDGGAVRHRFPDLVEGGSLDELPLVAFIPRTAGVDLVMVALPSRIVEVLIDPDPRWEQSCQWRSAGQRLRGP